MYTNSVNHLYLETSTLEGVDDETERSRRVGTRENVLVHKETPGEVLELPSFAKSSNLQEEDTVIVEHVVDLAEESTQVTDTDVLSHLKTGDLVVATRGDGNFAVIHAENVGLFSLNASLPETVVAPSSLVTTQRNTSDLCAIVYGGELCECAPSAANVEHFLARLQVDLLADNRHLVVLQLFQALFFVDIRDDARGVDHAGTEEPAVEVITTVIMVADLFFVWRGVSTC